MSSVLSGEVPGSLLFPQRRIPRFSRRVFLRARLIGFFAKNTPSSFLEKHSPVLFRDRKPFPPDAKPRFSPLPMRKRAEDPSALPWFGIFFAPGRSAGPSPFRETVSVPLYLFKRFPPLLHPGYCGKPRPCLLPPRASIPDLLSVSSLFWVRASCRPPLPSQVVLRIESISCRPPFLSPCDCASQIRKESALPERGAKAPFFSVTKCVFPLFFFLALRRKVFLLLFFSTFSFIGSIPFDEAVLPLPPCFKPARSIGSGLSRAGIACLRGYRDRFRRFLAQYRPLFPPYPSRRLRARPFSPLPRVGISSSFPSQKTNLPFPPPSHPLRVPLLSPFFRTANEPPLPLQEPGNGRGPSSPPPPSSTTRRCPCFLPSCLHLSSGGPRAPLSDHRKIKPVVLFLFSPAGRAQPRPAVPPPLVHLFFRQAEITKLGPPFITARATNGVSFLPPSLRRAASSDFPLFPFALHYEQVPFFPAPRCD